MDRFAEELAIVKEIYNRAWEKNWGFVPMTSEEIDAMAKKLKPLLYPPCVLFVEMDGKPVAFLLAMPGLQPGPDQAGRVALPVRVAEVPPREEEDRPRAGRWPSASSRSTARRGFDAVLYYEAMKEGVRIGTQVGRVLLDARGQPRHPEAPRGLRRADLPPLPARLPAGALRRVDAAPPASQASPAQRTSGVRANPARTSTT